MTGPGKKGEEMTNEQAKATLRKAFASWTEEQKAHVRDHLRKGTLILCGDRAELYADEDGGL